MKTLLFRLTSFAILAAGLALPAKTFASDYVPPGCERIWIEPIYETVCKKIYCEPEYRTVCKKFWIEPVYETVCKKFWVEPVYETVCKKIWIAPVTCEKPCVTYDD